ncbi:MAG: universal stress protein [Gammaproteobacteria bacterium]|nr:universal stress protein [Gammaproteobacteria bacterium]
MSAQAPETTPEIPPLPGYANILLAVDSSDHSNRGTLEAVALASHYGSQITAAHVYAAKLHDIRFRQMEGGLPEQFREEDELERQRDVHDDLITRGLSIITDSYMDQAAKQAGKQALEINRCALEGKNYRELANEANSGRHDLLVMGALGLGAVKSSRIGTVCNRVARRSQIDTLVIKEPVRSICEGPVVVAVDGSSKSYGGLLTALSLAKAWEVEVKIISAFDPYYHYVAFNRIAGVLSEEAGQAFKFKEQEKLHEEIIDSGLAKIYQGHLSVAQSICQDHGVEAETTLLDGKPHEVIARYLQESKPSLLIVGTTGIHADEGLDIGGNSELLLQDTNCAILLSQRKHRPQVDRLASVTTSWTNEAEARMERAPSFVRPMAKMAILRYAQEQGHTVITESIVDEATAQLMPNHAEQAMEEIVQAYDQGKLKNKSEPNAEDAMRWSEEATRLLLTIKDLSLRGNLSMRAEKKARSCGLRQVEAEHINNFIDDSVVTETPNYAVPDQGTGSEAQEKEPSNLHWQAAALARLIRVPEGFMRDSSKQRIEDYAHAQGHAEITLAIAEAGLADARKAMEYSMQGGSDAAPKKTSSCPFAHMGKTQSEKPPIKSDTDSSNWKPEAEALLSNIPAGFCRDMTRKAAQCIAEKNGLAEIQPEFIQQVMQTFQAGSGEAKETMPWESDARKRIAKAPDIVRGMLIKEIEGWAARNEMELVTADAVDAIKQTWAERGVFHLDPADPRNS